MKTEEKLKCAVLFETKKKETNNNNVKRQKSLFTYAKINLSCLKESTYATIDE